MGMFRVAVNDLYFPEDSCMNFFLIGRKDRMQDFSCACVKLSVSNLGASLHHELNLCMIDNILNQL